MRHHIPLTLALRASICLGAIVALAGCAAFPTLTAVPARPDSSETRVQDQDQDQDQDQAPFQNGASTSNRFPNGGASSNRGTPSSIIDIPNAAAPAQSRSPATDQQIAELVGDEMVDATLAPQSIPQFVATAFGTVIGVPFSMTPDVAVRNEVMAGGTGGSISKRDLFRLTQQALKQYGIDVYIENGFVSVGNATSSNIGANVLRDRSVTPNGARVVQFFPVQTIDVNVLQGLLTDLFPNLTGARITPDSLSNSLLISGPGREVSQVVRVLREIDQPRFAGSQVLRVQPVFWSTDNLAASLEQVLVTEGYVVSRQALAARSIVILSFPSANQLLIFTRDPVLLERVKYWVDTLDRPAALGDKPSTFVYQVRNTDAQSLGQLAIGQPPTGIQVQAPVGVAGTPPAGGVPATSGTSGTPGASGAFLGGRVLTDPVGNRIIFTGTASDFDQLRNLMQTLDIPAPQVVIEVMIAEVTLSDVTRLGINFSGNETNGDGTTTIGTEGITLGAGGVLATFVGPEFRARINAEASNRRINILQRPQLVVRSGGTARFQVGTDVPIITSQRATDTSQNGNGTDVLQSVQYRQTGVILDLKPVVYGDRVDIQISQENSTAGAAPEGISSPTILNRSLTTQIAITDGWTGVLGGLIANNYSKTNGGVPFLKDIPLIGSAFQNNSVEGDRTELLILITPYIVRNDEDMADFAERYASDMNAAFRTGRGWSYTLTPFSLGANVRGVGIDLPSPNRPSDASPRISREEPVVTQDPSPEPPPENGATAAPAILVVPTP
ncbi:secretin N-terminal domain-containing protein [Brevundimonas sp. DC300-4]|uniref:secretin N-terminal domain-containing protein n=1 Tax=Brevundimonas sp. DC300-4 TaxID=2804594 RepID=UPI003CF3FFA8